MDYLYNGERVGMFDKGVPEIWLFQSDGIMSDLICKQELRGMLIFKAAK